MDPLYKPNSGHSIDPVAIDFLIESNRIEGMPVPTTEILEAQHRSREIRGSLGVYQRLEKMGHQRLGMTWEIIEDCHRTLMFEVGHYAATGALQGNVDDIVRYAGHTRTKLHELVSIGNEVIPPVSLEDKQLFFQKLQEGFSRRFKTQEDILRFAARAHLDFEDLHPFFDGNGRLGRLLVVYILAWYRLEPSAVIFTAKDAVAKNGYYTAFPSPKKNIEEKDESYYGPMEEYVRKKYQETVERFRKIL